MYWEQPSSISGQQASSSLSGRNFRKRSCAGVEGVEDGEGHPAWGCSENSSNDEEVKGGGGAGQRALRMTRDGQTPNWKDPSPKRLLGRDLHFLPFQLGPLRVSSTASWCWVLASGGSPDRRVGSEALNISLPRRSHSTSETLG